MLTLKSNVFAITAYKVVFFICLFLFCSSATNQYQSIPIYLSTCIGIDNRYQSITTWNFAIDWLLIININRLIDIDWYWLISIVIDYRFYRLDTPGFYRKQWKGVYFNLWRAQFSDHNALSFTKRLRGINC